MATNILTKHFSEMTAFKNLQKKEWSSLLKEQENWLANNSNVAGVAERFQKERDEHNKKFAQDRKDLLERQQKELEEFKKLKQLDLSNDEMER